MFPPAIGGSGKLLKNIYRWMRRVKVTVITDGSEGDSWEDGMQVIREPMRTKHWGLMHPAGLRHHLRVAARVRVLCSRKPMVVHCCRLLPEGLDAWLARCTGGARYVCWVHGEEISYADTSRELRILMRLVHSGAAALIANSRNTASIMEAFGIPRDRIDIVSPGVDATKFRPGLPGAAALRARWANAGQLLLLTVGRLERRKGHDLVLRALASDALRTASIRYLIVGEGEELPRLQAMTSELGLTERVTFIGRVEDDALPAYFSAADIFVHPNRSEGESSEGFGLVFLEAAAAGVPTIGGVTGGVPEALERDVTGLIVSGTDAEELAQSIRSLASSPELRSAMGKAGRARAERDFSWESAANRVTLIHERVARGQNRS